MNPESVYMYAKDIVNGRVPELENVILKDPMWAYYYARDIIKGRWPEAESIIMNSNWWRPYSISFLGFNNSSPNVQSVRQTRKKSGFNWGDFSEIVGYGAIILFCLGLAFAMSPVVGGFAVLALIYFILTCPYA